MATFVIGETGLGKSRLAGTWPSPLWLNGEPDGPTTALRGRRKPPTIDIKMDNNAINVLNEHLEALSRLTPDENGLITYKGVQVGSVVLDSFDAFQDIAKMRILGKSRTTMEQRDWGTLETIMRWPLIHLGNIQVPVVIISHVKTYDRGENRNGRKWWSAQGGITTRLDRLASEILHIVLVEDKRNGTYARAVATQQYPVDGYILLAKDRNQRLAHLANKNGLILIEGEDGYPPDDIAKAICNGHVEG